MEHEDDIPLFEFDCMSGPLPPGTKAPPRPPGRPRQVMRDIVGEGVQVYVPLLDEGTAVWRPVAAVCVAPLQFRLTGSVPEGESWQFQPSDVVRCDEQLLPNGERNLIAVEKVAG